MAEGGHTYEFGPPRGGWPSFDAEGKRIREEPEEWTPSLRYRCAACGQVVGVVPPGVEVVCRQAGDSAEVSIDGEVVHTCGARWRW